MLTCRNLPVYQNKFPSSLKQKQQNLKTQQYNNIHWTIFITQSKTTGYAHTAQIWENLEFVNSDRKQADKPIKMWGGERVFACGECFLPTDKHGGRAGGGEPSFYRHCSGYWLGKNPQWLQNLRGSLIIGYLHGLKVSSSNCWLIIKEKNNKHIVDQHPACAIRMNTTSERVDMVGSNMPCSEDTLMKYSGWKSITRIYSQENKRRTPKERHSIFWKIIISFKMPMPLKTKRCCANI